MTEHYKVTNKSPPFCPPSGPTQWLFQQLPVNSRFQSVNAINETTFSVKKFLFSLLLLASFHGVAVCQENRQEPLKEVKIVPAYFVGIRWASTGQKFLNWEDKEAVVESLTDRTKFDEKKNAFLAASAGHKPKAILVEGKRAFILFRWSTPVTGQKDRKRMDVELLSGKNVTKIREEMAKRVSQNAVWYLTQPEEFLVWDGVE